VFIFIDFEPSGGEPALFTSATNGNATMGTIENGKPAEITVVKKLIHNFFDC